MKRRMMRRHRLTLWLATTIFGMAAAACSLFDPEVAQKYPWTAQPLRAETKAYFCQQLNLPSDHPICRPAEDVLARDLLQALQDRFPVNTALYPEVAEVLKNYPSEVEESTLPDGTVTGRAYVYLLTEFDGYCIYFYADLHSEVVHRIGSTGIGSGPSPTVCGSAKLRQMPRPFLSPATPESNP